MGGSGGYFGNKPGKLADEILKTQADLKNEAVEAEVSAFLADLLVGVNDRDVDAIQGHLATIKQALEKDIEGTLDLSFGGSVSKHTYADGISDVDALVVLNDSELQDKSPEEVCEYLLKRMQERLPRSTIERDGFAIRVTLEKATIDLVPVVRTGERYQIPNSQCTDWAEVAPKEFAAKLTSVNRSLGGKVVPVIKLAKVLLNSLPTDRRPTGLHLEALAVRVFESYDGAETPKAMLSHFFREAPTHIQAPLPDVSGQSVHVDGDLGGEGSLERLVVANAVDRIGRRMRMADASASLEQWKALFPEGG